MQLEWLGDDDLTVFAVTDAGHVWMSGDGAETWRDLTTDASNPLSAGMADPADRPVCKNARRCEGGFLGIVTLDHMPNYVFFESKNDQHYATTRMPPHRRIPCTPLGRYTQDSVAACPTHIGTQSRSPSVSCHV